MRVISWLLFLLYMYIYFLYSRKKYKVIDVSDQSFKDRQEPQQRIERYIERKIQQRTRKIDQREREKEIDFGSHT